MIEIEKEIILISQEANSIVLMIGMKKAKTGQEKAKQNETHKAHKNS
jgi:hypothetical protein